MADVSSEQQQQYMASNTTSASPGPSPTTTSAAAASASPDPKNVQDLTNYVSIYDTYLYLYSQEWWKDK